MDSNKYNNGNKMKKTSLTLASAILFGSAMVGAAFAGEPCKMYIKLGGGYSFASKVKVKGSGGIDNSGAKSTIANVIDKTKLTNYDNFHIGRFSGGLVEVGLGYNFTEQVRADLTVSYANLTNKVNALVGVANVFPPSSSVTNKRPDWKLMANAYYDFNTSTAFTPFVGIGIGGNHTKNKSTFNGAFPSNAIPVSDNSTTSPRTSVVIADAVVADGSRLFNSTDAGIGPVPNPGYLVGDLNTVSTNATQGTYFTSKTFGSKSSFIYGGTVGISYKMSEGVLIDLAYKIENMPKYKYDTDLVYVTMNPNNTWKANAAASKPVDGKDGGIMSAIGEQTKTNVKNNFTLGLRVEF